MKVIDLLNMISEGKEVPEKINYNGEIFAFAGYNSASKNYINELEDLFEILDGSMLNDTVETLEEEKKIPEKLYGIVNPKEGTERVPNNEELMFKINEIIDYLNSKGDK